MKKILWSALLAGVLSAPVWPQAVAGLGAISGDVRDGSGAAIAGAEVTIQSASKGVRRQLTTNDAGAYFAGSLVPSPGYVVTISKPGFASYRSAEIDLQVGQNLVLDAVLEVAASVVRIQVPTAAPLIEHTRTDVSQVVSTTQIDNLPINGRRVDSFVLLTPGVVPDGTFGLLSFRGIAGGNSFLTDGNDTTEQFYNENAGRTRIPTQISQDAVQEFQVLLDGYSAEFGRASGGVVNTVTRSGSNQMHGTAYWFFRNQDFNARDPFASSNPAETRHQGGASLGGRLVPDKLFYFVNAEVTRRNFPLIASLTRPPFFDSTGHFVAVQPNGRPTCGAPATPEQCSNAIHMFDRQFQTLPRTADADLAFGKIDWRPAERHSLSFSFNYMRWLSPNGLQTAAVLNQGSGVGNNANSSVRDRYGRMSWTFLPGSTVVNEFRFGWFKDKQFDYVSGDLNWPGIGMLGLTIQGQANLGTAVNYPRLNPSENRYQFADNVTWSSGKHTWKAGLDLLDTEDFNDTLQNRAGTYTYPNLTAFALDYSGNTTGLKHWQSYSQGLGNPVVDFAVRDYAFFVQDQYRVTANLSLTYGLRYDYSALPQPISLSPATVNPDYPATGRIPVRNTNFAPRVGIAYGRNRTVLRAGFGIFYARYQGGLLNTLITGNGAYQRPVFFNGSVAADLANGPQFPARLPPGYTPPPAGNVDLTLAANNFRSPYTQQGNVALERELANDLGLTVSYLWTRGLHLTTVQDLNVGPLGPPVTYRIDDSAGNQVGAYTTPTYLRANRVNPRWNHVNLIDAAGDSYYNALAVQLRKRMSHGLEASLAYTWSHAIDDNQGPGSNNVFFDRGPTSVINGDYRGEKGSSVFDQRQRLSIATVWEPRFTRQTGILGRLANHWELSQISTLASAPPATATVTVSGTPFPGAAFPGTLNGLGGSTRVPFWPVNSLRIDSVYATDARIARVFALTERLTLKLHVEGFNILNHPYFTNVLTQAYTAVNGVLIPVPRLGQGSATGGFPDGTNARRLQVGARLSW